MSEQTSENQLRLAIYGKGGIGKSFVAGNLSVLLCADRSLLHVGCDPKGDSTRNLLSPSPPPALERLIDVSDPPREVQDLVVASPFGPDCVEAGGPEPGEGCGGMGILKLFQFLERKRFFARAEYRTLLFDVLGDVVCGGFVAPLRFGSPLLVVVVVSEEVHSLYAANQVAKAVARYHGEGSRFAGLVLNRREAGLDVSHVERFTKRLGTTILADLPRTTQVLQADGARMPIVLYSPKLDICAQLCGLAGRLAGLDAVALPAVTPLSPCDFELLFAPSVEGKRL